MKAYRWTDLPLPGFRPCSPSASRAAGKVFACLSLRTARRTDTNSKMSRPRKPSSKMIHSHRPMLQAAATERLLLLQPGK